MLIIDKLDRWFWYYGVLPLVFAYIICLNFTAEFVDILLIERDRSITLSYMGVMLFYSTLGMAFLMIFWCIINAFVFT